MVKWTHWCKKNGCGKQVVYDSSKKKYICRKCNKEHTREEVKC